MSLRGGKGKRSIGPQDLLNQAGEDCAAMQKGVGKGPQRQKHKSSLVTEIYGGVGEKNKCKRAFHLGNWKENHVGKRLKWKRRGALPLGLRVILELPAKPLVRTKGSF